MKKSKSSAHAYQALKALREGVRNALLEHKKAGASFSVWKDGKVLTQPASKITKALLQKL